MRSLWSDAGAAGANFEGEFFTFHHAHSFPKPVQPGGVPIHIGGHSEAAARRAGRVGDGFQPLGLSPEDLAVRLDQVRASADEAGRDPDAIELSLSGYLPTTSEEDVLAAESAGADRLVVSTSISPDLALVRDEMTAFAERFGLSGEAGVAAGVR
jgi:alkanesulfonate monooxygenase SsuD/methylene tetrahydromethanopterin reductase-like flavin-dependent oxidoreductase (luciferase family)